ncbi:hypothetical protein VP01_3645g1 [Puccinia sorghi]|uniref:Uncharacterized protein n=1 Tax=Puccinia sorghi TaxID=27349 RepID=A0A0L6UUQ0_9BASI|nr:hypothetical protein VP01_3645g1 [Puccinia sorghi]
MNFLNSGDQIINSGGARGEIEDNLEDEDGGSVADRAHAGDDGFKGGSLDICDRVVIDTGVANRAHRFGWSSHPAPWNFDLDPSTSGITFSNKSTSRR